MERRDFQRRGVILAAPSLSLTLATNSLQNQPCGVGKRREMVSLWSLLLVVLLKDLIKPSASVLPPLLAKEIKRWPKVPSFLYFKLLLLFFFALF